MSENKFLAKMRGEKAPKSLVEVKNDKFLTPFVGLPKSTDVSHGFQNDAESSVIVANAAKNWGLQKTGLGLLEDASNAVYTGGVNVAGQNAWINLSYTFPTSSDSTNSVVSVINPSSKWVLRLVGKDLFSQNETIGFELVVKIGSTNIANIECATTRQAGFFCKTFVVDFSDSADKLIKVNGGDKLTVQLFCKDKTATACYYTGNSVLSLLERRIDADVVANEKTSFEDIVDGLKTKQDIATAVNYDNITNCITEIPQDIKLESNNGTLTLKAGSKVYVPNGNGVFQSNIYTQDKSVSFATGLNGSFIIFAGQSASSDIFGQLESCFYSGSTAPTFSTNVVIWYDTSANLIKFSNNGGSTWASVNYSFPLAKVTLVNGEITSIDQVFNGFGYIGSTVFVLPGVKGLIPNGKNADGTLNNTITQVSSVRLFNNPDSNKNKIIVVKTDGFISQGNKWIESKIKPTFIENNDQYWYNPDTNKVFYYRSPTNNGFREVMSACNFNTGADKKITSILPKQTFHAVDYSDTEFIANQAMPSDRYTDLTLGTSDTRYTAPADGYVMLKGNTTVADKAYGITNESNGMRTLICVPNSGSSFGVYMPVSSQQQYSVKYEGALASGYTFRFVYANGAK